MKFFKLLGIAFIFCVLSILGFAGCDEHICEYSELWSNNNVYHWRVCIDKNCDKTSDKQTHTFQNDSCSICGYIKQSTNNDNQSNENNQYSVGLNYILNSDGKTLSVSGIGQCYDSKIIIPDMIDGKFITQIESNAFINLQGVKEIIFGCNIQEVKANAFVNCNNLDNIVFSNSITTISDQFVSNCPLEDLTIEKGIKYFENLNKEKVFAFSFVDKTLINIEFAQTTKWINSSLFVNCDSIQSVFIPANVIYIGSNVFYDCENIEIIAIADNSQLKDIGQYAFLGCAKLEEIQFPSGITNLGKGCFKNCTSLKKINNFGENKRFQRKIKAY